MTRVSIAPLVLIVLILSLACDSSDPEEFPAGEWKTIATEAGVTWNAFWDRGNATSVYYVGSEAATARGVLGFYNSYSAIVLASTPGARFNDLDGLGGTDLWIAGYDTVETEGAVFHWTGTHIEAVDTGIALPELHGVFVIDSGNRVLVGNGGTILRYSTSAGWALDASPTTENLYAVWGSSASDIWAVGQTDGTNPTILYYDGAAWSAMTQVQHALLANYVVTLWDVHGASANRVAFVGNTGALLMWTGTGFQEPTGSGGTTEAYTGVHFADMNTALAVGSATGTGPPLAAEWDTGTFAWTALDVTPVAGDAGCCFVAPGGSDYYLGTADPVLLEGNIYRYRVE